MGWVNFDDGATIGQLGSEAGVIVRDVEHSMGARMTIERTARAAPYAITCGIYGAMAHTRFFADETQAQQQFEMMKRALEEILRVEGEDWIEAIERFIEAYP